MILIAIVIVRNSLPQPLTFNYEMPKKVKTFVTVFLIITPIACICVFTIAQIIGFYGFKYSLFDWREGIHRCDFDAIANFFAVSIPGILVLFVTIFVLGMCTMAAFIKVIYERICFHTI